MSEEARGGRAGFRPPATFARRKGKRLRPGQAGRLEQLLPALSIDTGAAVADIRHLFTVPVATVHMEIGFGGGEHLLHEIAAEPQTGFIGCEPFLNGIAKLLAGLADADLPRLRLHAGDAVEVLDRLPPASLDRVWLLYPDPWPKRRHWKRRFVRQDNLERLARVLKPGGEFRFASDVPDYVAWTLERLHRHTAFEWTAETADDWRLPWHGWPGTRYEAKAVREGRTPAYLTFRRL